MADNFTITTPAGPRAIASRDKALDVQVQEVDVALLGGASAAALTDTRPNPTALPVGAHAMAYDTVAGSWYRAGAGAREMDAASVLASAARTSTASSPITSTQGARGLACLLNVTAVPAAGADLNLEIRGLITGSATFRLCSPFAISRAGGAGGWYLAVYPGAKDETVATTRRTAPAPGLPPRVRIAVVHSDTNSWTYECSLVLLA